MWICFVFQAVLRCDFPRRPRSQQGQQEQQHQAAAAAAGSPEDSQGETGSKETKEQQQPGAQQPANAGHPTIRASASSSSVESTGTSDHI